METKESYNIFNFKFFSVTCQDWEVLIVKVELDIKCPTAMVLQDTFWMSERCSKNESDLMDMTTNYLANTKHLANVWPMLDGGPTLILSNIG